MKIKTELERVKINLRFYYEQKLGRDISAKNWNKLISAMQIYSLALTKENCEILAHIHKATPKHFSNPQALELIVEILQKLQNNTGKITGNEVAAMAKAVCNKAGYQPANSTIYRWFSKTSEKGYKSAKTVYNKTDVCIVAISALGYKKYEKLKIKAC